MRSSWMKDFRRWRNWIVKNLRKRNNRRMDCVVCQGLSIKHFGMCSKSRVHHEKKIDLIYIVFSPVRGVTVSVDSCELAISRVGGWWEPLNCSYKHCDSWLSSAQSEDFLLICWLLVERNLLTECSLSYLKNKEIWICKTRSLFPHRETADDDNQNQGIIGLINLLTRGHCYCCLWKQPKFALMYVNVLYLVKELREDYGCNNFYISKVCIENKNHHYTNISSIFL